MSMSEETSQLPLRSPPLFATTHWSVVLAAGNDSSPGAQEALERLCRTYWLPLYAYVRRRGYTPEDSQDLTQAFFANFLEKNAVSRARRERGRFRSFLLTSLQNFLAHEWEKARAAKRGGGSRPLPWDEPSPEGRYQLESSPELSPDKAFERRWAMTLFQQALTRLHAESTAAGKAATFNELKSFLSEKADEGAYAAAAKRLRIAPAAVGVAVHRLRKRYGELVREEIAHTVATPGEIEDEMRHLIALMSG
jgi:DNA-directed RNA polymerase specialized sigma24 family protein